MGEAELDERNQVITIRSHIIIYGDAADETISKRLRDEIEFMWNEPKAHVFMENRHYLLRFRISAECISNISDLEIISNTDPANNYFRIESFIHGNISFVDGIGCNTGYFLLENLYDGSTTAAHEYGHTLGLKHPKHLDIRGQGVPGIMYPRGTIVDAPFQYDPSIPPGRTGGTMHPRFRKVKQEDVDELKLHKLDFTGGTAIVGAFTNIYHRKHIPGGTE